MKPLNQVTSIVDSVAGMVKDGVILADTNGQVLYHNQAATDLLGMPSISDLQAIRLDSATTLPDLCWQHSQGSAMPSVPGNTLHLEHKVKHPDEERVLEFNLSCLDFPDMSDRVTMIVVTDSTATRRLDTLIDRAATSELITQNRQMQEIVDTLGCVAPTRAPVLLQGESGTGKSMFAKIIHNSSDRAAGPFIKLNCAAIPENLLESELFGHVKGAFTGAMSNRPGRFQAANGGTLFLDEISEIPVHLQPKLLTALEEQRFQMVGSDETVEVDIRVIAASNQNLAEMVETGNFRADLYYRIGVFNVEVPPLRERPDDIPLLIKHLCKTLVSRGYQKNLQCTEDVMGKMLSYPWPGNIRELANAMEHAMILAKHTTVTTDCLPKHVRDHVPTGNDYRSSSETSLESQQAEILGAISEAGGNRAEAARILGIDRSTLWRRMHRLGIADAD